MQAKLVSLEQEFNNVYDKSSELPFWNALLWTPGQEATLQNWILADAWYRSRCLELPTTGTSMVPALDMVNHATRPSAYYQEDNNGGVSLLVRPGVKVSSGDELTISYGDSKSPAEMLFSYGFIDEASSIRELTLPLESLPDDPLAKAKLHVYGSLPTIKLALTDDGCKWESPFAYLQCLNEEDGLEFRILQDNAGERQLKLFWQDTEATHRSNEFEALVRDHELCSIFRLRVITILEFQLRVQFDQMTSDVDQEDASSDTLKLVSSGLIRHECLAVAQILKQVESTIVSAALETLEIEVSFFFVPSRMNGFRSASTPSIPYICRPEANRGPLTRLPLS